MEPNKQKFEKLNLIGVFLGVLATLAVACVTFYHVYLFGKSMGYYGNENIAVIENNENVIYIKQCWGNLEIYQHFQILNTGQKRGFITSIEAQILADKGSFNRKFSAKFYSQSGNTYPMNSIPIYPDNVYDIQLGLNYKQITNKDSISFYDKRFSNTNDNDSILALTNSIKTYCSNEMIDFKPGKYLYKIPIVKGSEKTPFDEKYYSFNIEKEPDLTTLKDGRVFSNYNALTSYDYRSKNFIEVKLGAVTEKEKQRLDKGE